MRIRIAWGDYYSIPPFSPPGRIIDVSLANIYKLHNPRTGLIVPSAMQGWGRLRCLVAEPRVLQPHRALWGRVKKRISTGSSG